MARNYERDSSAQKREYLTSVVCHEAAQSGDPAYLLALPTFR